MNKSFSCEIFKPTEEEFKQHVARIESMKEFFKLNDIDPAEAIVLCFQFGLLIAKERSGKKEDMERCFQILINEIYGEKK